MDARFESQRIKILKLHKRWADGLTILSEIVVLLVFGGIYFLLDQMGVAPADRILPLILLAVIVLVVIIWQSVGLAVARIHMLMENVDLSIDTHRNRN